MDIERPSRSYQLPHSELLELSPRDYTEFRPSAVIDQTPEVAESRFRPQFRPSALVEPRDLPPRKQYFAQPSAPKRYEEPRFQVERPIKQLPLKPQKFPNDRPTYSDEDRYRTRYDDGDRFYKPRPSETRQKYYDEEPPRYKEELPRYQERPKYVEELPRYQERPIREDRPRYQERPKYVEDLPEYYEERPKYQKTRPYDEDDRLDYYALPDTKVEQKYEKEVQYEPEEKFISKPKYHKEIKSSADHLEQFKPEAKPQAKSQAKPYVLEPVRAVEEPKRVVKEVLPLAQLAPLRPEQQEDKVGTGIGVTPSVKVNTSLFHGCQLNTILEKLSSSIPSSCISTSHPSGPEARRPRPPRRSSRRGGREGTTEQSSLSF